MKKNGLETSIENVENAVKPINFNKEKVMLLINGTKHLDIIAIRSGCTHEGEYYCSSPKYEVGDILYVREPWRELCNKDGEEKMVKYSSDVEPSDDYMNHKWQSPESMPEHYARHYLKVESLQIGRMAKLTDVIAKEDGYQDSFDKREDVKLDDESRVTISAKENFIKAWDKEHCTTLEKYGWNANPWVLIIKFSRIK